MSELDDSTEMTNELIMESTKNDEVEQQRPKWHNWAAFFTLLMALFTTIGALLAGITAHEVLLERTKEVITLSASQGDRLTGEVLKAKHEILVSMGETPDESEIAQIEKYEAEAEALDAKVARAEARVQSMDQPHLVFLLAVVLLSAGITLSGMSFIIERKFLWYLGIVFGVAGALGVGFGIALIGS